MINKIILSNLKIGFFFYPRSTRNSNATLSLSNFFATPEDAAEGNSPREKASPIPMDIDVSSSKIIPMRASNVFEHPGPKPKKAPKLKGSTSGSSRKGSSRSKKQPSISNFLRNEKMFSEVTAQHCIADNFSPDDIEMALALSKSEAEKQGGLSLKEEEDAGVDFVEVNSEISPEKIRRKLEKYGFRTARKEDYKSLAVLPVVATKLNKRSKWANKFTALTLRNPKVQQKKLEEKVSNFLAQQVQTKELNEKSRWIPPYDLISLSLLSLKPHAKSHILHEPSEGSIPDMSLYYVTDLMEISYMPANHLLKNWNAIQGRDLSPERETSKCRQLKEQFDLAYIKLEKHFEDQLKLEQEVGNELEKLVAKNMIENGLKMDASSTNSSPLKEPPDKRPKIVIEDSKNESISSTCSGAPNKITRCTSPDLFADSDEEPDVATATVLNKSQNFEEFCDKDLNNFSANECLVSKPFGSSLSNEAPDVKDFSLKVYKNISLSEPPPSVEEYEDFSQITTYEIFSSSSDEVKTVTKVTEKKNSSDHKGNIDYAAFLNQSLDDLTDISKNLNEDNAELKDNTRVFDESPILTVGSNDKNEFCPISQELYLKYAKMDKQASLVEDKEDIFLDFESDFHSMDNLSFQLDKAHSNLNKTKESFSEFNSKNSLQRNVSFSNDHSFKNSLNWKKNSPVKNGVPSPFECSDASIDLTLNNSDENEAILLSDEEINYSIWKANKSIKIQDFDEASSDSFSSPIIKKGTLPHFQTEEDLDAFLMDFPGEKRGSKSSRSPNKSILSKERAEFGILDAAPSQPSFLSQIMSPSKLQSPSYNDINWSEASFLDEPVKPASFTRKSIHKFDDLFNIVTRPESQSDNDFDEFDQLVFPKSTEFTTDSMPNGLDSLLMSEIKVPDIPGTPMKDSFNVQLEVEGNMYNVRACPTPKPDFATLPEEQILQQLYNYGIKPLKRKQAVKMLEFIYNQTHPIMQATFPEDFPPRKAPLFRSKSSPVIKDISKFCYDFSKSTNEACLTPTETRNNFKFKDATGEELLRFSQSMTPSLCDDFEFYVLQTNITKKTLQPLVPLHIAWHNLLCANSHLYESVLMYEPIDLQEVYLHLKQMGHRFDPKDLKSFFDRRCIIFRYDLTAPGKQAERHIQKQPKRASKKK
ncbi:hypothetical protein KR074_002457 [Drosophila pseudoananassae]|nr:hypothetical protein KR074_002457 [Drosophila pseudoananassae]